MVSEPDEGRPDETRSFTVLSPGTMISHYRIIEKIGEGGMGVVYKAEDTKLRRTVALKFLPPRLLCDSEARERFEHEAQAASALNHPNIATIHEIDEVGGRCFIAMEYLEGGSLKGLLKKDLSMKEVLDLAVQIGEGLNAAHESRVVHRDIKPDNIMLTGKGLPKIMDFGLAKLKGATKVTKTGTTLGTLQYMSPEQASGQDVDRRSDIFSFGVIFYEMVTGRLPFRGDNEAAIINSILNDTPEPLARYKADVPEGVERIVDRALEKDPGERYQHADDMVAELRHEKRLLETGASRISQVRAVPPASRRRLLPILIPAVVAAAVILLIFVFEPFRVEMGPQKEALAKENSLAIMYFENLADREDPEKLGEIVTNLLITDLSESRYMSVVSGQRLYDILKLLGKEGTKIVDKSVASEVATRAQARWMLLGSILQVEPRVVLTSRLVEVESGRVVASQRITGEVGEQIFTMVDKLTVEIKEDLSLPAAAQEEADRAVADVTTYSPEAYRYYLEGLDYDSKYYYTEGEESYKRAVEADTTFAMAYFRLSALPLKRSERKAMIDKAMKYIDRVSKKEKHWIRSQDAFVSKDFPRCLEECERILELDPQEKEAAFFRAIAHSRMGEREEALYYFSRAIEIDPLYKLAYNELAVVYHELGDFEKAIWAINKYISLAPDEPNPYDTQGQLYGYSGKLDQAIESYRKALEIRSDFTWSLTGLGHMYLFKREYARAESCYQKLCTGSDKGVRSWGRTYLAYIPLHQGKFKEALRVADEGIAADRMEQAEGWCNIYKLGVKTLVYEETDLNLALRETEKAMEIAHRVYPDHVDYVRNYYAELLAKNGEIARAEEVAEALREDIVAKDESQMYWYWHAAGWIEWAKGDLDEAVTQFEKVVEALPEFWGRYQLAKTYLESGRLEDAVTEFETALLRYDDMRALEGTKAVRAYYLLGLAYEKSGWSNKAIEQYETFLDIWKAADPGIPEVEDARQRLAQLKQAS